MITLRPPLRRSALRGSAALVLGALAFFASAEARSAPQGYVPEASVREVTADSTGYGGQLALPVGGSRILRFSQPIGRVLLGEPKVGDVIPLGERTLYVLGKAPGTTSLTVLPRGGGAGPMATLDVRVGYDVDATKRALHDIMPTEPLEVSARGEGMVLTGLMSSSAAAAQAAAVAEQYAPGHVLNLTSIRGAEQVMLSVRVAEVQRTALQQLGVNIASVFGPNGDLKTSALGTGTILNADPKATTVGELLKSMINPDAFGALGGIIQSSGWSAGVLIDALERRGLATTLAEPNLVALSGETAVFFAGGEFPVPVPQQGAGGLTTITIEYKQYGVSIGFTPTVYGDTINLLVAPEVSALDPQNSVLLQGFRIPGLTTRRAKTTVELRNGQSFAIAGLIRREFSDTMRGLPGVGSLPVFGALFRSKGYQNNETEVVIIVTARLAKPTDGRSLLLPTELRKAPDAPTFHLNGATDVPVAPPRPAPIAAASPAAEPLPRATVSLTIEKPVIPANPQVATSPSSTLAPNPTAPVAAAASAAPQRHIASAAPAAEPVARAPVSGAIPKPVILVKARVATANAAAGSATTHRPVASVAPATPAAGPLARPAPTAAAKPLIAVKSQAAATSPAATPAASATPRRTVASATPAPKPLARPASKAAAKPLIAAKAAVATSPVAGPGAAWTAPYPPVASVASAAKPPAPAAVSTDADEPAIAVKSPVATSPAATPAAP
jgi:pilus assembly protein CpaC